MREAIEQFINAKHESCVVRAKVFALGNKRMKAIWCAQVAGVEQNKALIWPLVTNMGACCLSRCIKVCQQLFIQLFGTSGVLKHLLWWSIATLGKGNPTWDGGKFPGLDGLSYNI